MTPLAFGQIRLSVAYQVGLCLKSMIRALPISQERHTVGPRIIAQRQTMRGNSTIGPCRVLKCCRSNRD